MKSSIDTKGGVLRLRLIDLHGNVFREIEDFNLEVNLGKSNLVLLLGGDASGYPLAGIGVGTDNTPAAVTDTGLTGAFTKALNTGGTVMTYTSGSPSTVTTGFKIDTTEAVGMTIWEFGLFDAGGNLNARKVLSTSIVKTNTFAIEGTWTITVN